MPYPQDVINRIIELVNEIERRKEHPNAAATYKDIPALKEIEKIVNTQLSVNPSDLETLTDSVSAMRYLGNAYEYMWRIAYAVNYYKRLLELQVDLFKKFGEKDENAGDDYYIALRTRNYYRKDACDDLVELAKELLPDEKRKGIEKQIFEDFHPLKHDPIELTEAYLSVIDEVDRRMDTEEIKKMHFFQKNELFKELLKEYGIKWRPVTALNPNVHFD